MAPPTVAELALMIDHSIIDPFHTDKDLEEGVALAKKYGTGRFVTQPFRVKTARQLLEGSNITLQTFVGFHGGNDHTEVKVLQAQRAIDDGAQELDMIINISALMSGDIDYVKQDVKAVVDVAKPSGVPVKAILETYVGLVYLNDDQVQSAALAAEWAGVSFIKTSTGLRPDTTDDIAHKVALLRSILKPETAIKASGGCYTIDAILAYYKAGARRFGASATASILDDYAKMLTDGTTGIE